MYQQEKQLCDWEYTQLGITELHGKKMEIMHKGLQIVCAGFVNYMQTMQAIFTLTSSH